MNISDSAGAGVFTGRGYWQRLRHRWQSKTSQRTQQRQKRRQQRTRDTRRVWGIGDKNGGGGGQTTVLRNIRQQRRCRRRKMSTKNTTTTMDASADYRRRIQGIEYNDRGGSRLTTGLVDWQQQRSVYFPCFQVGNSNTFLYLSSRCLILILFHQITIFSVGCMKYYQYLQSCRKSF